MNTASESHAVPFAFEGSVQLYRVLAVALWELKGRLQEKFEEEFPGRAALIRQAVSEAEEQAWRTAFPQLLLPDFAEVRVAELVASRERGRPSLATAA